MLNINKLEKVKFQPRTKDVPVPELAAFFDEGEDQAWTVRNLTGKELAIVNDAAEQARNVEGLLSAFASSTGEGVIAGVKQSLGLDDGAKQPDYIRRLRMLKFGSVSPTITDAQSVKLATVRPVTFYNLTNAILVLTGEGAMPGE